MKRKQTEQRIKLYFDSAPAPNKQVVEETAALAVEAASRRFDAPKSRVLAPDSRAAILAPSFTELVLSQARMTKGLVWILQAAVVVVALVCIASVESMADVLAAFGAASAILAGIGIAGVGFGKSQGVTEICYSCHFDYQQIVVARMIAYGLGDAIALGALVGLGSVLIPNGFATVALCSGVSFFASGFICMFALARYRGESALVLCTILSGITAALTSYAWTFHFDFLQQTNAIFWLVLAVGAACGIVYCARTLITRIDAGFDHISARTN